MRRSRAPYAYNERKPLGSIVSLSVSITLGGRGGGKLDKQKVQRRSNSRTNVILKISFLTYIPHPKADTFILYASHPDPTLETLKDGVQQSPCRGNHDQAIGAPRLWLGPKITSYLAGYCQEVVRKVHTQNKLPLVIWMVDDKWFRGLFLAYTRE